MPHPKYVAVRQIPPSPAKGEGQMSVVCPPPRGGGGGMRVSNWSVHNSRVVQITKLYLASLNTRPETVDQALRRVGLFVYFRVASNLQRLDQIGRFAQCGRRWLPQSANHLWNGNATRPFRSDLGWFSFKELLIHTIILSNFPIVECKLWDQK